MAMTTIIPTTLFTLESNGSGTVNSTVLNSTDDWIAWTFYWTGGDLTRMVFLPTAVTGSNVVTVQVFNVDTSNGTTTPINTGSAIGSAVDSGTLVANTPESVSGIGQTSLTAGVYAVRVIFKSGTSATISRGLPNTFLNTKFPMQVTVANGGAQTRNLNSGGISLGTSTLIPMPGFSPPAACVTQTFDSAASPDEYGLWFTNPWPCSVRIWGVAAFHQATTHPDVRVAYYTGPLGSPSQDFTVSIDRDITFITSTGGSITPFSTKQTLASGATAGIGYRATTANNLAILYFDWLTGNEAMMDAWWGQGATLFTRVGDAGALTQVTYQTPIIMPIIDGIDPGSGSVTGIGVLTGGGMAR